MNKTEDNSYRYSKIKFHNNKARLAQLVERKALNLVVVGSSPTVGVFFFHLQFILKIFAFYYYSQEFIVLDESIKEILKLLKSYLSFYWLTS